MFSLRYSVEIDVMWKYENRKINFLCWGGEENLWWLNMRCCLFCLIVKIFLLV